MDLKEFNDFLNSEKGKMLCTNLVNKLIEKAYIEDYQIDKLHSKGCFIPFLEKVLAKYESDNYVNRYEKRNKQPKETLLWFLYHYALKYGRRCSEEEINLLSGEFTRDLVFCNGYIFHVIGGQGSFIKIFKSSN